MDMESERIQRRYENCLMTYKSACEISGVEFPEDVNETFQKGVKNCSLDVSNLRELENRFRHVILEKFTKKWISIIEKNFETKQRENIYNLIDIMLKSDPALIFDSFNTVCNILERLDNEETKEDCLKEIEENSTSIETVVNNYSLLFDSKFSGDIIKAIRSGLEKNPKVAPYVSNLFGTKSQQEQEDVPELVGAKVKTEE